MAEAIILRKGRIFALDVKVMRDPGSAGTHIGDGVEIPECLPHERARAQLEINELFRHANRERPAILHVADIIVNAMQYGSRGEFIVAPLSLGAWIRLGLSVSILPQVVEQVDRQFRCMVRVFFGKCCGVN
jgi:hypothetical protein